MSTEEWKETAIQVAGRPVKGKYCVFDGQVTVAAWNGTKTAQVGIGKDAFARVGVRRG